MKNDEHYQITKGGCVAGVAEFKLNECI